MTANQHDYVIANQSGSSFRSDLNTALEAIVSVNQGAQEPATKYKYQYWVDTSVTPALLKQRNAANDGWITLAEIGGQTLAVDGTATKPGLSFAADTNTGIKRNADDEIGIVTGGTEYITIKSNGNVGINKTNPDTAFHVAAKTIFEFNGSDLGDSIRIYNGADLVGHIGVDQDNGLRINGGGGTDEIRLQTDASDRIVVADTRITFKEDVGLGGEATPVTTLHVKTAETMSTSTGNTPGIFVRQDGGSSGSGNYGAGICFSKIDSGRPGGCISSIQTDSDGDRMGLSFFTHPSSNSTDVVEEKFRIRHDGALFGTDTNIGTLSDQRLKENVAAFTYSLDNFKLLQPKVFDWKNPEAHSEVSQQRGFVAQELETADSYWVDEYSVNSDHADAQYLDEDRVAKTSKLGSTDAMYVSVIQQLLAKVEALETKVAALEAAN